MRKIFLSLCLLCCFLCGCSQVTNAPSAVPCTPNLAYPTTSAPA